MPLGCNLKGSKYLFFSEVIISDILDNVIHSIRLYRNTLRLKKPRFALNEANQRELIPITVNSDQTLLYLQNSNWTNEQRIQGHFEIALILADFPPVWLPLAVVKPLWVFVWLAAVGGWSLQSWPGPVSLASLSHSRPRHFTGHWLDMSNRMEEIWEVWGC